MGTRREWLSNKNVSKDATTSLPVPLHQLLSSPTEEGLSLSARLASMSPLGELILHYHEVTTWARLKPCKTMTVPGEQVPWLPVCRPRIWNVVFPCLDRLDGSL